MTSKILFLATKREDYLQDTLLIGLRTILGETVVDVPRKDIVYKDYDENLKNRWGRGFTTTKIIDEIPLDRSNIENRIRAREFSHIVFSSIHEQNALFVEFCQKSLLNLPGISYSFIDGADWRRPHYSAIFCGKYFKREQYTFPRIPWYEDISFSIPDCKMRDTPLYKDRLFAMHVQCDEAYKIPYVRDNCQKSYAFDEEETYYENIARSEYAVTMRKGGWDCMRHYEIAANLTVPCFYNFTRKPRHSAPHGLKDMVNSIYFDTAAELQGKLNYIRDRGLYSHLQNGVQQWIRANSSTAAAARFLRRIGAASPAVQA